MIEQGIQREHSALGTIQVLAGNDPAALKTIIEMSARMKERRAGLMNEAVTLYGEVSLEDVVAVLEAAVEAGALQLVGR
ncbi:MAG: hypothetical protein V3T83_01090 [Acidobacteriota bacterium]